MKLCYKGLICWLIAAMVYCEEGSPRKEAETVKSGLQGQMSIAPRYDTQSVDTVYATDKSFGGRQTGTSNGLIDGLFNKKRQQKLKASLVTDEAKYTDNHKNERMLLHTTSPRINAYYDQIAVPVSQRSGADNDNKTTRNTGSDTGIKPKRKRILINANEGKKINSYTHGSFNPAQSSENGPSLTKFKAKNTTYVYHLVPVNSFKNKKQTNGKAKQVKGQDKSKKDSKIDKEPSVMEPLVPVKSKEHASNKGEPNNVTAEEQLGNAIDPFLFGDEGPANEEEEPLVIKNKEVIDIVDAPPLVTNSKDEFDFAAGYSNPDYLELFYSISKSIKRREDMFKDCLISIKSAKNSQHQIDKCVGKGFSKVNNFIDYAKRQILSSMNHRIEKKVVKHCYEKAGTNPIISNGCDILINDVTDLLWLGYNFYDIVYNNWRKYTQEYSVLPYRLFTELLTMLQPIQMTAVKLVKEVYDNQIVIKANLESEIKTRSRMMTDMERRSDSRVLRPMKDQNEISTLRLARYNPRSTETNNTDGKIYEQIMDLFPNYRKGSTMVGNNQQDRQFASKEGRYARY